MKTLLLTAAACLFATTALADRIKSGGYVGCITEDALDEFISPAVAKDGRAKAVVATLAPHGDTQQPTARTGLINLKKKTASIGVPPR